MPKAFLLAAGLGTRLRPLTNEIPKCLLPIGGKPLLQIWLEHLGKHRVNEVLINTHWHHEKVEEFLSAPEEWTLYSTGQADYTDLIEKPKNPRADLAAAGIYVADKQIFN